MTLVTITTTQPPTVDLCTILGGDRFGVRSVTLPFASAHLFFPEVTPARCTAALLVEPHVSVPAAGRDYLSADVYMPSSDTVTAARALLADALERCGRRGTQPVEISLAVGGDGRAEVRLRATATSLLGTLEEA